jgi:hypothetical protein
VPTTYKVLGQVKPTAATATTLYTVPASTQTVISTFNISNLTNDPSVIRLSIRPAGAAQEDKHYLIYNNQIGAFETLSYTIGITLGATDVVTVYDTAGKCAFNLFGSEIS